MHRLTVIDSPAVDANAEVREDMSDALTGWTAYKLSGQRELAKPFLGSHDRTTIALTRLDGRLACGGLDERDVRLHATPGSTQHRAAVKWWAFALRTENSPTGNGPADPLKGRPLFEEFTSANAALGAYLTAEREKTRAEADVIARAVLDSAPGLPPRHRCPRGREGPDRT
ncbi:MAG: hypothetical protein H7270_09690 [Dermatophilaceae bacterium]|nr:hypothetical protein [Dermatophilaceae bacterium]